MDDSFADTQKNDQGREDSLNNLGKGRELSKGDGWSCSESKSKRMVKRVNSQESLTFKVKQLGRSRTCGKESFFRSTHAVDGWIPKHMVTVDEKYLRQCLEFIHASASKAAPCNFSLNLGWENMGILSGGLYPGHFWSESVRELSQFDFDCTLAGGTGNMVISAAGQWVVGSIMGGKSMKSILKSPLLQQYGALDGDTNLIKSSFVEVEGLVSYSLMNSPDQFVSYSSHTIDKAAPCAGKYKYVSEHVHEHNVSMSSTNSTSSDQSSSSLSASVTRGMLQCIWKGEEPHFIFSLDDEKVVYMANLGRIKSIDDMALDYVYLFHSRMAGQKVHGIPDSDSHLVGKMIVSTSFTFRRDQSRMMEREFVLFGVSDSFVGEMHASSHGLTKNKGLSKKVSEVFRVGHSMKKRKPSRFGGSSAFLDHSTWEPIHGVESNTEAHGGANPSENLTPNFELAAIVVKDHLADNHQEKIGGWGLKFLKRVGLKQTTESSESMAPICSSQDTGTCSTSMDIIVPAGLHGGPRTRNGGPSSLTERWRSGGCCDCGGWDLGCPLTVLKCRSSNNELLSQADMQGDFKFVELFRQVATNNNPTPMFQGLKDTAPSLRMVNVHNGLYFVHFQSTLSALQSFSIAVAIIHAQSAALRPKNIQELK